MPGTNISAAEVTHVSINGFWLLLGDEELLLPFSANQRGQGRVKCLIQTSASDSILHVSWSTIPTCKSLQEP